MTATALRGQPSTDPRGVDRDTNDTTSEVEVRLREVQRELIATGHRVRFARLRDLYWRWLESAQTDWDFGAYVLAYADPTGETATGRALRAEIARRSR